MLLRLIMLPLPRAAIFGASAATRKYAARTLAANSRSKVATPRSAGGPNQENPALLTRTSTGPACSAMSSSWARSPRSAATKRAFPPSAAIASTTAEPRPASRPCTTNSAPLLARRSATARPMPEVAPVTSALRPSRSRCSFMSCPPRCALWPSCAARLRPGYPKHDCTWRASWREARHCARCQHGRATTTVISWRRRFRSGLPERRGMPGPGDIPSQSARIIGREAGLATLRGLVDPVPQASQVLLVIGEAGMGKTVMLADAAEQARSAGMRVLPVTGRESESKFAFAGLHQLLRPVLSSVADLPGRQAQALRGALGLASDAVVPDPLLTGVAVLTLLSDLSERSPVLVVADDAHWIDRSSLDALAFAGSRLDAERVVLLLGARGHAPPPGFDRGFPELDLEPLSAADAGRLLDGQPHPPRGRARAQVLAQAAGNPMALIELATVIADDPAASRRWAAEPLPLTDRLSAVLTARFAALPEQAQAALLLAAVADGPDLSAAASHGAWPDAAALAPAEQLGLVKIDRTGLRFSHPLVRSAIYHSAPFARRAAAHRALAEALHDQPDRRAWHLAAAALHPDEDVASLLEATATQAQRRGGAAAAALAMERAAELSPEPEDQARRLVAAASAAVPTGQADWVQDLAPRALAITAESALRLTARHDAGWALPCAPASRQSVSR